MKGIDCKITSSVLSSDDVPTRRERKTSKWLKDYLTPSIEPRSLEGRVSLPSRKRERERESDTEAPPSSNRQLSESLQIFKDKTSCFYSETAFLNPSDLSKWRRASKAYDRRVVRENPKELSMYRSSPFYKKAEVAYEGVKKEGNDYSLINRFELKPSPGKGLGVFASQTIAANTVLGLYGAEVIEIPERKEESYLKNHYLFALPPDDWFLDGKHFRSMMGMVNHSGHPNATAYYFEKEGEPPQVFYFSKRKIRAGEEVTINYDDQRDSPVFFENTGEAEK